MIVTGQENGSKLVELLGVRGSPEAYRVRDFLQRSTVRFRWTELATDEQARREAGVEGLGDTRLPVVRFPDGPPLFAPDVRRVADRLGWISPPKLARYDLSVYGAGPAGLSAAVYAASEGLKTVVIEREAVGGQAGTSSKIENYLGFPGGVGGAELAEYARQQAVSFGAEILVVREGVGAEFHADRMVGHLADGGRIETTANICATGAAWRKLGLAGEERFWGRGLYYGAGASEAALCRGEHVYVVGGGNSAGQAVMHFARHAEKVTMLVRGESPAASLSRYLLDRIEAQANVEVLTRHRVAALDGDGEGEAAGGPLHEITIADDRKETETTVRAGHLFACIGAVPNTEGWGRLIPICLDEAGYVVTGADLPESDEMPRGWTLERSPHLFETSIPGNFAVGDVRSGSVKRVAAAVGEGAMAVQSVHRYLDAS